MSAALVILLILGLCYSATIAPDITWAHFSADGGDLIAATATGGVPHPSGYPLYLILARPFQLIPAGTLAFRTNLFSAVCTILASLVLYAFLVHRLRGYARAPFAATLAALAYGLAPFIWGQALVTEVYALHGLLMIACLYVWSAEKLTGGEWTRGFVFGIAATNHLTSLMIFPLSLLAPDGRLFVSARAFLLRCGGLASGLLLYLVLPLRASFQPPVNWGDASTAGGFFWLVSGQLYQEYIFSPTPAEVIQRFGAFAGLLLDQYTWIGVLIGIYGLFSLPSHRIRIATLWMGLSFLLYAAFYGSVDSQVNLLPVWLVFAIWIAYGSQDLLEWLRTRSKFQLGLAGLLLALLFIRAALTLPRMDLSEDAGARDFIDQALQEIPHDSLVFVDGDAQIFSLWYAQYALDRRSDLVIAANGLLPYEWYTKSLQRIHPSLNMPERGILQPADLIAVNPDRVVCYISADQPLLCIQTTSYLAEISKEPHDFDLICLPGKSLSFAHRGGFLRRRNEQTRTGTWVGGIECRNVDGGWPAACAGCHPGGKTIGA